MNKDKLTKLADLLDKLPPMRFNQDVWNAKPPVGLRGRLRRKALHINADLHLRAWQLRTRLVDAQTCVSQRIGLSTLSRDLRMLAEDVWHIAKERLTGEEPAEVLPRACARGWDVLDDLAQHQ